MRSPRKGKDSFLGKGTHADFPLHMEQKFIPGDKMGTSGLCRVEIILNLKSELFFITISLFRAGEDWISAVSCLHSVNIWILNLFIWKRINKTIILILIGAQMNIKWMLFGWIHCEHWNLLCLPINQGGDGCTAFGFATSTISCAPISLVPGLGKSLSLNLIWKNPLRRDLLMIFHYLIVLWSLQGLLHHLLP